MNAEFGILYGPQGPIYLVPGYLQGTPICPFFNCTPHPFDLVSTGGHHYRLAPTGVVARRAVKSVAQPADATSSFDVAVSASEFGPVVGLPAARPGVLLIVSGMVLDAPELAARTDLRAPDTAPDAQVRDSAGRVVGIKRLRVQARQQPAPTTPAPTTPAPTTPAPTEEPTTSASEMEALEALGVRPYGTAGDKPVPYYSVDGERLAPYPVPQPARYVRRWGDYNPYNPLESKCAEDIVFGRVTRSEETWGLAQVEGYGSVWLRWEKDKRRRPVAQAVGERLAFLRADLARGDKGWRAEGYYPAWMADGLPTRAEREADKASEAAYVAALAQWEADKASWRKAEEARLYALHGPSLQIDTAGWLSWGNPPAESWLLQHKWAAERAAEEAAAAEFAQRRAAWEQADETYRRWDAVRASSWRVEMVGGAAITGSTLYCTADEVVVLDNENLYRRLPTQARIGWNKIALIQCRASDGGYGVDWTLGEDDNEWATSASEWLTVWAADDDVVADDDADAPSMADVLARAAKLGVR